MKECCIDRRTLRKVGSVPTQAGVLVRFECVNAISTVLQNIGQVILPCGSGRERRCVGRECHHVVERRLGDIGCHLRAPRAVLKIVKLPHEVARGPPGEAGDRSDALQFGPILRSLARSVRR
jgi:hypothetical protein